MMLLSVPKKVFALVSSHPHLVSILVAVGCLWFTIWLDRQNDPCRIVPDLRLEPNPPTFWVDCQGVLRDESHLDHKRRNMPTEAPSTSPTATPTNTPTSAPSFAPTSIIIANSTNNSTNNTDPIIDSLDGLDDLDEDEKKDNVVAPFNPTTVEDEDVAPISLLYRTATDPSFFYQVGFVKHRGGFKVSLRKRGTLLSPIVNATMRVLSQHKHWVMVDEGSGDGGVLSLATAAMGHNAFSRDNNNDDYSLLCHAVFSNPGFHHLVRVSNTTDTVEFWEHVLASLPRHARFLWRLDDCRLATPHASFFKRVVWVDCQRHHEQNPVLRDRFRALQHNGKEWKDTTNNNLDRHQPHLFVTKQIQTNTL